jgi:hypothetical protein
MKPLDFRVPNHVSLLVFSKSLKYFLTSLGWGISNVLLILDVFTNPPNRGLMQKYPTSNPVWVKRFNHFRLAHMTIFIADSDIFTIPAI